MVKEAVNTFPTRDNQVCLGMKKRGHGIDKWNGFGGKVVEGETEIAAAVREIYEETGIKLQETDLILKAELYYYEEEGEEWDIKVFTCSLTIDQEPVETEEMRPAWFPIDSIPFDQMWSADSLWLPQILAGKYVKGTFWYDNTGKLLRYDLNQM